jgi:predicted SAM-dependent methyltransferase
MNIEIGGGTLVQPGWINLDSRNGFGAWQREAQSAPWPTGDSTVDHVRASHVLEHVPAGADRIAIFNEVWRVLKPGGTFEVILPLVITENGLPSWHSIADPTHVSFWCRESFHYFTAVAGNPDMAVFAANADYGLKLFYETHWSVNQGFEGHWHGTPAGK